MAEKDEQLFALSEIRVFLEFLLGRQLTNLQAVRAFLTELLYRKTYLWMIKPGGQNHPHSWSIYPPTR